MVARYNPKLEAVHTMKLKAVILLAAVMVMLVGASLADDSAALYKSKCAMCHAANGAGDTPVGKAMGIKDLKSPDIQAKSDATLAGLISNGINKMPAFKSSLSQAQIDGLAKFIHTLK